MSNKVVKDKVKYFTIAIRPGDKEMWMAGAEARGLRNLTEWFRMLAAEDIRKSKKFYKSQEA